MTCNGQREGAGPAFSFHRAWEGLGGCGRCFPSRASGADLQWCVSCSANGQLAQTLQQAYLPTVSYATCSSPSYWGSTVKNTMVCAGGDGVRSGCQVSTHRNCDESLRSLPTAPHLFLIPYSTPTYTHMYRLNFPLRRLNENDSGLVTLFSQDLKVERNLKMHLA